MRKIYVYENNFEDSRYRIIGSFERLRKVPLGVHVERGPNRKYVFYLSILGSSIVEAESDVVYSSRMDAKECGTNLVKRLKLSFFESN